MKKNINKNIKSKSLKSIKPSKPSHKKTTHKKSVKKTAKIVRPSKKSSPKSSKIKASMTVSQMINLITEAIQYKFANDKTAAGLTISKLKNDDFYVSVVRFGSYFGKDKMVEYKARNASLMTSLMEIAGQIIEDQDEIDPIVKLSKHLFTSEKNVSSIVIYDMD